MRGLSPVAYVFESNILSTRFVSLRINGKFYFALEWSDGCSKRYDISGDDFPMIGSFIRKTIYADWLSWIREEVADFRIKGLVTFE